MAYSGLTIVGPDRVADQALLQKDGLHEGK